MHARTMFVFLLISLLGCAANRPSSILPRLEPEEDVVLVKSLRIPDGEPWISRFAQHSWIDYRRDGQWCRMEVVDDWSSLNHQEIGADEAQLDERWGRAIRVLSAFGGDRAKGITGSLSQVQDEDYGYRVWPGPNSNTFTERLLRETPGLWAALWGTSVGRDYAGWGRVGLTGTGTGVEVETVPLGLQLGLREGVELHVLGGLTFGIGLWPLSITLPLLPPLGPRPEVRISRN